MSEVTQVIEVLFLGCDIPADKLEDLQSRVADYALEEARQLCGKKNVPTVSVSAYIGDASLSNVGDNGFLPKGVEAFGSIERGQSCIGSDDEEEEDEE